MSMKDVYTKSQNFTDSLETLPKKIEEFLLAIKKDQNTKKEFSLVHALVFPKNLSESEKKNFNKKLGETYSHCGFGVLGGDTSSGQELSVFISAIVF